LIARERIAMKQIQGFAFCHVLIGVENLNLSDKSTALQSKRRARTHPAATTDD
jgi:hypothetical protein